MKSAWQHRRWRHLLMSFTVSTTGDFLYSIALLVYLIDRTNSAAWVAASVSARIATYTFLGPIGGVLADRFDRRKLMLGLDLARAVLMGLACLAVAVTAAPLVIVVIATAASALGTPYRPATVAATPLLVPEDDLAAANAAEATVGQLAWFVGPALGAVVVAFGGAGTAFAVNGATFLVSAILIAPLGDLGGRARTTPSDDEPQVGMGRSLLQGVQTIRDSAGLLALTVLVAAVLLAFGIEQVVQVLVVTQRLGLDAGAVGIINACLGAGGLLAVPLATRLGRSRRMGTMLAGSAVFLGIPLALLAVTSNIWVAGALCVVEGAANVTFDVLFITLLQRVCPEDSLARVYSLQDSAGAGAQLVGSLAAPLLVTAISLEAALVFGGGSLVLFALLITPALRAMTKRTEAERARLAPVVERLRVLELFDDASQAALERIARAALTVEYSSGQHVFVEGDDADTLFIIETGCVSITTQAEGEVRTLGPGDWFGEIGIIRGIPRTATVTATERLIVDAIPGSVFADAIAGRGTIPDPIAHTLTVRLARTHPELLVAGPSSETT